MQSDTIKNKEEKTGFTEISAVASEDKKQSESYLTVHICSNNKRI